MTRNLLFEVSASADPFRILVMALVNCPALSSEKSKVETVCHQLSITNKLIECRFLNDDGVIQFFVRLNREGGGLNSKELCNGIEVLCHFLEESLPKLERICQKVLPGDTYNSSRDRQQQDWPSAILAYLAHRKERILDEAIEKAINCGEDPVARVLSIYQDRNRNALDTLAAQVISEKRLSGQAREADILQLLVLDLRTYDAEMFATKPIDCQQEALESGIQAAHKAVQLTLSLEHKPCEAFFRQVEAYGWRATGELEKADRSYFEAEQIFRKMQKSDLETYKPDFVHTLSNRGVVLKQLGLLDEAEVLLREAESIIMDSVNSYPGEYEPDLCMVIEKLSNIQSAHGRLEEAAKNYSRIEELQRQFADAQPDKYGPNLAITLNNYGATLYQMGKVKDAKQVFINAEKIYCGLSWNILNQNDPAHALNLANLGAIFDEEGQLEKAENAYRKAVEIRNRLAWARPDAYEPELAATLKALGEVLIKRKNLQGADPFLRKAEMLLVKLSRLRPKEYELVLLATQIRLGDLLKDLEKPIDAMETYRRAFKTIGRLPQDMRFEPKITLTLLSYGHVSKKLERFEEAERAYKEVLSIFRNSLKNNYGVHAWMIAAALTNLSSVLYEQRRVGEACQILEEAIAQHRKLMPKNNSNLKMFLASLLYNLGLGYKQQDDLERSREAFLESLELFQELDAMNPGRFRSDIEKTSKNLNRIENPDIKAEAAWALSLRRWIGAGDTSAVQQAIKEAISSNDHKAAEVLMVVADNDQARLEGELRKLYSELKENNKIREALTISLLHFFFLGRLVETFWTFPAAEQEEALKMGIDASEHGIRIASELEDRACEAFFRGVKGSGCSAARNLVAAETNFREAMSIFRELSEEEPATYGVFLARARGFLGQVLIAIGKLQEAEIHLAASEGILHKFYKINPSKFASELAYSLESRGIVLHNLYRLEEAEKVLSKSVTIQRGFLEGAGTAVTVQLARTLDSIGNLLREMGKLNQAEEVLKEALCIYNILLKDNQLSIALNYASTLSCLGMVHRAQQRYEDAEAAYTRAESVLPPRTKFSRHADSSAYFEIPNNLGNVLELMGRNKEAEAKLCDSVKIAREEAEIQPAMHEAKLAISLVNYGRVLQALQRHRESKKALIEAINILRRLAKGRSNEFRYHMVSALLSLANVYSTIAKEDLQDEEFLHAEKLLRDAETITRQMAIEYPPAFEPELVKVLNNYSNLLRDISRTDEAEEKIREAIAIHSRHPGMPGAALPLSNLGRLLLEQERSSEAIKVLEEAINKVENLYSETTSLERRRQILSDSVGTYESLIAALVHSGRQEEALEVAERGRSRTVAELLRLRDLELRNANPELVERYSQSLINIRVLEDAVRYMATMPPQFIPQEELTWRLVDTRKTLVEARSKRDQLYEQILSVEPDFVAHTSSISYKEAQQLPSKMPESSSIALIRVTTWNTFVFLIHAGGDTEVLELKFSAKDLANTLLTISGERFGGWIGRYWEFQKARSSGDSYAIEEAWSVWQDEIEATLNYLYKHILHPIHHRVCAAQNLQKGKPGHLILVPNRALAVLPLHACWWIESKQRKYLTDTMVIRYAPNLTVFSRCLDRSSGLEEISSVLAIANPTGDICCAEMECLEIERCFSEKNCQVLWRDQGRKEEVLRLAPHCHIIHLACHGLYQMNSPLNSFLHLAGDDGEYAFTLKEILRDLDLSKARLAVLSACETSLGDPREVTDEYLGLPAGFLHAGVPTVWGSLWAVDDAATALLMSCAYRELHAGFAPAAALRQAQIWLRDLKRSDVYLILKNMTEEVHSSKTAGKARREAAIRLMIDMLQETLSREKGEFPFRHPSYWAGFQNVGI